VRRRSFKPLLDRGDISFWCPNAFLGLFLESMQNVDSVLKPDGINSAIRVAVMVFNDLNDTRIAKALERFSTMMLAAGLRQVKRIANHPAHFFREIPESLARAGNSKYRLGNAFTTHSALCHIWHAGGKRKANGLLSRSASRRAGLVRVPSCSPITSDFMSGEARK